MLQPNKVEVEQFVSLLCEIFTHKVGNHCILFRYFICYVVSVVARLVEGTVICITAEVATQTAVHIDLVWATGFMIMDKFRQLISEEDV